MGQAQLRTPTWQCAVCSDGAPPSLSPPDFDGMDTIADIMILDDDENECAPPPACKGSQIGSLADGGGRLIPRGWRPFF